MNRFESKYLNTARLMDEALILLLEDKEFEYVTVKEICKKAGVNRSTFYLHYESTADLLEESVEYLNDKFFAEMTPIDGDKKPDLGALPPEKLYFMTPEYIMPYLEFIKRNKRQFSVVARRAGLFKLEKTYKKLFNNVFGPVLARFGVPESERVYQMAFYINGLTAITNEWLKNDCDYPVEEVARIMRSCVRNLPEEFTVGNNA